MLKCLLFDFYHSFIYIFTRRILFRLIKFKHIFLFIFLVFFGKSFALPANEYSATRSGKENKFDTSKKKSDLTLQSTGKIAKQKRPKKPKGIQVIVPNVSTLVFHKFYRYSEFTVHEVNGTYSLLLHYSHGKRGPPAIHI